MRSDTCELDFCNRPASCKAKTVDLVVCKGHYNQNYNGCEFKPFRIYVDAPTNDLGRVCTRCDEFKNYSEFYIRTLTGKPQSRCKECMIEMATLAQARRKENRKKAVAE